MKWSSRSRVQTCRWCPCLYSRCTVSKLLP